MTSPQNQNQGTAQEEPQEEGTDTKEPEQQVKDEPMALLPKEWRCSHDQWLHSAMRQQ